MKDDPADLKAPPGKPAPSERESDFPNSRQQILRDFAIFGLAATEILVFTGAGIGLGYLAWTRWGFPWWIILVTSLSGLTLAMIQLWRLVSLRNKKQTDTGSRA